MAFVTLNGPFINQSWLGAKWIHLGGSKESSPKNYDESSLPISATPKGFIGLSCFNMKSVSLCLDETGMNVWQRELVLMVRSGRGLLVGDTKRLLCNQLGVKSPSQRLTKAGGWWLGWDSCEQSLHIPPQYGSSSHL